MPADNPLGGLAEDMGFGGSALSRQVQDETEEQRKRRLMRERAGMTADTMPVPGMAGQLGPGLMSLMGQFGARR